MNRESASKAFFTHSPDKVVNFGGVESELTVILRVNSSSRFLKLSSSPEKTTGIECPIAINAFPSLLSIKYLQPNACEGIPSSFLFPPMISQSSIAE